MVSSICIESFIGSYFESELNSGEYEYLKKNIIHWDMQDTDDDNATECYFYVSNTHNKSEVVKFATDLASILGIESVDCARIEEQTEDGNPEIRIEYIVEIGDRRGRKFK